MSTSSYRSDANTDPGHVRRRNEDAVFADDTLGVYFVVDGMGGQNAGHVAAQIASTTLKARLERRNGDPERRIREAIALANNAVFKESQRSAEKAGMGCVLTVAVIENGKIYYGHVGDTRLYKIRNGDIRKLTHDHSPVGELEDAGQIAEQEAMNHPRRNEVFRDAGSQLRDPDDEFFSETGVETMEPDSAILLCSDGLSDVLSKAQIRGIVESAAGNPGMVTGRLIDAANEHSKDNVSAVYVEGPEFSVSRSKGESTEKWRPQRGRSLPILILVLGAFLAGFFLHPWLWQGNQPRTLLVSPNDIPSISQAMEQARAGDRIQVAPGDYRELIHVKDGVELVGDRVTLIAPANSPEAVITIEKAKNVRVHGFSIRGEAGEKYAAGITVRDSEADLSALQITGSSQHAVLFAGNSQGRMEGCHIQPGSGPGIVTTGQASLSVELCQFVENKPSIAWQSSAKPVLRHNVFPAMEDLQLPLSADVAAIEHDNTFLAAKPKPRREEVRR